MSTINQSADSRDTVRRLEIVANQAIEEDLVEQFSEMGYGESFTYIHPVFGRGENGRREGSSVWPETNAMFVIYLSPDDASEMVERIQELKKRFPREGIRAWLSEAPAIEVV